MLISRSLWFRRGPMHRGAVVLAASLCLLTAGCLKPVKEHTTALAAATAPVIDQAAAAYQAANAIHEKRADYDEVTGFEKDHSTDKLRVLHPLMSDKDVELRLKVLKAFQLYVKTLVAITNGTQSKELDEASKSLGGDLTGLGNTVVPTVENALGIPATSPTTTVTMSTSETGGTTTATATTTVTPAMPISTTDQNLIATGANALGQFLTYRAIEKDLPPLIIKLDLQVVPLCKTMIGEVDAMSDAETIDFNYLLGQEKEFVMDPGITLSEVERRNEIAKMQELVREQHVAALQLSGLRGAIIKLAMTHHALAEELAKANPGSLKDKLTELIAAGEGLGRFYSSISSK
ncbi:hypothetical protein [Acidicapsa acidisoli]|uniref:hypothetical protein n=1 Tax=Acidicapsa acidisoli TaxID=1615681 RepID=UPI0021E0D0CB|nr:hypothetical protein [Acidicapsa acidisoli]